MHWIADFSFSIFIGFACFVIYMIQKRVNSLENKISIITSMMKDIAIMVKEVNDKE